jgi:hypothetical protein
MATPTSGPAPQDAQQMLAGLKWPDDHGRVSLAELLIALQFLGTDADRGKAVADDQRWDESTPASLQVIKSGVTEVTKWWAKRAGAIGGAAGLLAAIGGVVIGAVRPFREALGEPSVITLIAGGALILSATVLALAQFVNGDLMARAQATSARSTARAGVASTFLQTMSKQPGGGDGGDLRQELLAAFGAFEHVHVKVKGGSAWAEATAIQRAGEGFQVRITGGDWKPLAEIEQYTTDPT